MEVVVGGGLISHGKHKTEKNMPKALLLADLYK